MSKSHFSVVALAFLLSATATPAVAQDDADTARFQLGSVSLAPTIRLTNVGWDSNVYNLWEENNPQSDVTAIATPAVEGWMRTPRFRLNGRSRLDMYYFSRLDSLRAIDNDHAGRAEVYLNRVMPWVAGTFVKTRHRQNLEIDAISLRKNDSAEVGTLVRLSRKTSVGAYAGRSAVHYYGDAEFNGVDLGRALNQNNSTAGGMFRYEATPLTTITVNIDRGLNRFVSATERDSDSVRVVPTVEFKPLALVSGRASVGYRKLRFNDPRQPEFSGVIAAVDLQYTLRTRTQLGVTVQRDVEYSYIDTQVDYLLTGGGFTVRQRLGDRWDAGGNVGRYRLGYRRRDPQAMVELGAYPDEIVLNTGVSIGYTVGRTRIAFDTDWQGRESEVSLGRGYDRLRLGWSLSHAF